jgi:hypothetical protein
VTSNDEGLQPWHSYESMERYEALFPLLPDYVAQYTVGGGRLPRVGLSCKQDLSLRKQLLSVLIADAMQISLSHAEKRYAEDPNASRWLGLTDKIDLIYGKGAKYLDNYLSFVKDQIERDSRPYSDLSWQFFYRSIGSFHAAKRLSELGYLCEVATVLRSALEQFAFCAKLDATDESTDLKSIRPVQCLNHFKKFVPASGQIYGLMSKYTHFEFDHHTHFFAHSPNGNQTLRQAVVLRAYATFILFLMMTCTCKYVLAILPIRFEKVPEHLASAESFIGDVDAFFGEVRQMLPRDTILVAMDKLLQELVGTTDGA